MESKRGIMVALAVLIAGGPVAAVTPAKETAAKPGTAREAALADIEKTLGFVPHFFTQIAASALPGSWEEMKTLQMNDKTAIPPKYKELIGLAVSAQIPCHYCISAHGEFARVNGATEAEIQEAVALAGATRHWSTVLSGLQIDENKFRADISQAIAHLKKTQAAGAAPPAPIDVVDGKTALQDAKRTFGVEPDFLRRFPEVARAGAWKTMRDLEMSPSTAIPPKYKDLVQLAVSAQIPCTYCVTAATEFSRLDGATEAEVSEAVAMGAFTRQMSTILNGMKVDGARWDRDVARMVKGAQAAKKAAPKGAGARNTPKARTGEGIPGKVSAGNP